jgi:hypothetical protein
MGRIVFLKDAARRTSNNPSPAEKRPKVDIKVKFKAVKDEPSKPKPSNPWSSQHKKRAVKLATRLPPAQRAAYELGRSMSKEAIGPLLGSAIGWGLAPLAVAGGLKGMQWLGQQLGFGRQNKPMHMGTIGGIGPKSSRQLNKLITQSALRNYQLNHYLNAIRAAHPTTFRPMV